MPRHFAYSALAAFALAGTLGACGGGAPDRVVHSAPSSARAVTPPGPPHDPWGPWIREASRRFDVPERWIREVMRQESGGRVNATSPVGAMGLMQVMPRTYAELRRRHALGDDPYHPYDSIMAGTAYIREMYDLYGSPAFLAAYNAGPRRLEDFLYNRRGLPAETRNYVARVGPRVITASPLRRAPAEVYAAAEIPLNIPQGPRRMDPSTRIMLAEQRGIREQNARFAGQPEPEPQPRAAVAATRSAASSLLASGGGAVPSGRAFAHGGFVPGGFVPGGFVPGGVVAMDPIPDGSTPEGAARLAAAEPERVVVGRMDPIPDGSTPEGAARLAESAARSGLATAPLPEPVRAPPPPVLRAEPTPVRIAQARAPLPPPVARAAPAPVAPTLPPRTLGFISTAQAGTLPASMRGPAPAASAARWGVQVGAFASENLARSAAQQAGVAGGQVAVQPVQVGRSTLYRARVMGLSQVAAQQACDRLRRTGCQLVSPEG